MPRAPKQDLSHIDRQDFIQTRPELPLMVDGVAVPMQAQEFQTGSLGWSYEGTTEILVNGVPTKVWGKFIAVINDSKKV